MSATLNVTGSASTPQGTLQIQLPAEVITTPVGVIQSLALANGTNVITIPPGSTAVIIQPPAANAVLITLKGVAGDTGIPLHKTLATGPINLDTSATVFNLFTAGAIATLTTITFL